MSEETRRPLAGTVALVSGASRGIGRGIAHELGVAGAVVYVTGRSRRGARGTDDLPGSIDETASLVGEAGGEGIAVPCDHTDDGAVARLAEAVRAGHGRLDLLVNNAWGGYEAYDAALFALSPWEQPLWRFDKMIATGVRAQYVTTRALLPLLLERRRGLVVHVSAGDDGKFLGDVQYDVAKAAVDRLAFAFARSLRGSGATALAIHPGLTRTERVERHAREEDLGAAHSARYVGRAVVALADDPAIARRAGGAFKVATLGRDYGFADVDGRRPEPFVLPPDLGGISG